MTFEEIGIKKAGQSCCRFRISAIALDQKKNILGKATNLSRFSAKGGGLHAEQRLMYKYKNNIKYIIIFRVNNKGGLLPIEPCSECSRKAKQRGIKIYSINKNIKKTTKNTINIERVK